MQQDKYTDFIAFVEKFNHILVVQADNPDGDSLGTSLALESLLEENGKKVSMVCAVSMPDYLKYFEGWSRVAQEIPAQFDASIIVDTSSETLFEAYRKNGSFNWLRSKPMAIIDHHLETDIIQAAQIVINEPAVATSEIIYKIAREANWPIPIEVAAPITMAIMSDSLGFTSEAMNADTFRIVAELVDSGVSIAKLDGDRRELMKKHIDLLHYKGQLLQRVSLDASGQIATVTIPWDEIETYSPSYNPSVLVMDEMRQVTGVAVAIAYKTYPDGKITGKIRANLGYGVAGKLGTTFGGGGHAYAAGFKVTDGRTLSELHPQVLHKVHELLREL